jgi:aminoglycoside/choline kinase family phosphotransferase
MVTTNPQLTERVATLEAKVDNISENLTDLKFQVRDMHDCLDKTRDVLLEELDLMNDLSTEQHEKLASKVTELEKFKNKWTYLIMGAVAALGWAAGHTSALGFFK